MTPDLVMLHTSDMHVPTFNGLKDVVRPTARIDHVVREDWLARARQDGITWQLRREIDTFVRKQEGPVVCTCSTLGDAAEDAGAMRIDRPMMQQAARADGPILLVCALQATATPSLGLLEDALDDNGRDTAVIPLVLDKFWPLFECGDIAGYHAAIAAAVIEALSVRPELGAVVLAQVSMAPVAHLLDGADVPVFSAPETGLRNALEAQARSSLGEPITT